MRLRSSLFAATALFHLYGCATQDRPRIYAPPALEQKNKPAKPQLTEHYSQLPLKEHFQFAIPSNDLAKMREWIAAGFSAETRSSDLQTSAIQLAVSNKNEAIVAMLVENPKIEARPNPRTKIRVCQSSGEGLSFSIYEYLIFQNSISKYEKNCQKEEFYKSKKKQDLHLYASEHDLEIFKMILTLDLSKPAFQNETKQILESLRRSPFSVEGDSANARLMMLIESNLN